MSFRTSAPTAALLVALSIVFGCQSAGEPEVKSYLSGRITVSADVDSSGNHEGFEVVVASLADGVIDTLGMAITDIAGVFNTVVETSVPGVYPITIRRHGGVVKQGQIVIADGDSAVLNIALPTGRPLSIRSPENSAWMAYRNTKAAQADAMRRLFQMGSQDPELLRAAVVQSADILWKLDETYPNTLAAELAKVESVVGLVSWDDSLAVQRFRALPPDIRGQIEAARAAWRAQARLHGLDSALALIDSTRARLTNRADVNAMNAERVMALMTGSRTAEARREAEQLLSESADRSDISVWHGWATSVIYDLDHLQPGQSAPTFTATTRDGGSFALDSTSGLVLLEFYRPDDEAYNRELPLRAQLAALLGNAALRIVSVSLETDPDLNEAFIDTRDLPGTHIVAEGGADGELARAYNVNSTPRRFVLRDGVILSTYQGPALEVIASDLQGAIAQSGE